MTNHAQGKNIITESLQVRSAPERTLPGRDSRFAGGPDSTRPLYGVAAAAPYAEAMLARAFQRSMPFAPGEAAIFIPPAIILQEMRENSCQHSSRMKVCARETSIKVEEKNIWEAKTSTDTELATTSTDCRAIIAHVSDRCQLVGNAIH